MQAFIKWDMAAMQAAVKQVLTDDAGNPMVLRTKWDTHYSLTRTNAHGDTLNHWAAITAETATGLLNSYRARYSEPAYDDDAGLDEDGRGQRAVITSDAPAGLWAPDKD